MSNKPQLDVKDYQRAEQLIGLHRARLVAGLKVKPRWIDNGARFWYRGEGPQGHWFVLVDPAKESRRPAFDHERLAKSLAKASGEQVNAALLPFAAIDFTGYGVEFDAFGAHWRCSLDSYECSKVAGHVYQNPLEVRSPDGKWVVFRRDHDLWLRSTVTNEERALTTDGTADRSYASPPDCLTFGVLLRQFGLPYFPPIVIWSPDSRRVVTHRTDQRGVRVQHLLESVPQGGDLPVLHTYRYAKPGDAVMPRAELVVFDVETKATVEAKIEPLLMQVISPIMAQRIWWTADGSAVHFLQQSRDQRLLQLRHLDPATGDVRTLVEETGEPWAEPGQYTGAKPIVRVLAGSAEALWYSQRDGWGHLYLYDTDTGKLRGQLTSGEWGVQAILHVDERQRVVYFIASGLLAADPYRRQVCCVGLDGKGFRRLSQDDLDHIVVIPENAAYYVDSASTVSTPPVTSVRDWNGNALVELERADVSRLLETGWSLPERFCTKAADGATDIYGVIYKPSNFDPTRRYPVIDHPYPGPQVNRVHPCFGEAIPLYNPESMTALGFVVIAVDGRGTPGRSRDFHHIAYGNYDKGGFIEDHIAAIRELAKTRPWMDIDRGVGVFGASGGGYATLRAMFMHPEFYSVGISICGNHDQGLYQLSWGETYLGLPEGNDQYARCSNVEAADRLQGKLLLIHGDMDDNVHPHQTLRVVDRLIASNKDFELLIVPGAEHLFIGYLPYVTRRQWDFFVRNLLGAEPPAGYRVADMRPGFDAFFG